jgi:hypothetical protein
MPRSVNELSWDQLPAGLRPTWHLPHRHILLQGLVVIVVALSRESAHFDQAVQLYLCIAHSAAPDSPAGSRLAARTKVCLPLLAVLLILMGTTWLLVWSALPGALAHLAHHRGPRT